MLFATGHPGPLAALYQSFADALRARGCPILRAGEGWGYEAAGRYGPRRLTIAYTACKRLHSPSSTGGDVAVLEDAGGLVHSHVAWSIRATSPSWPPRQALPDPWWLTTAGAAARRRRARTRSAIRN